MCGFAGFLSVDGHAIADARSVASRMAGTLIHRGPDSGGDWADGLVALGHRRLSILDRSDTGTQPMKDSSGRYVIAYNGEIYNHLSIREELVREGADLDWQGHSDTETLLEAIAFWGLDAALTRADGMFALALWDRKIRSLSLARDRMGEKPLYWGLVDNTLVFGSELKSLRAFPNFKTDIDRAAVGQYLRFAYVPAPRSIYRAVRKLEPGTILQLEGQAGLPSEDTILRPGDRHGGLSIRRYWSLNKALEAGAAQCFTSDSEALDHISETLKKAVLKQKLSDVPLGTFLSGGVDSSLIVALMQAGSDRPVDSFTIGFDNPAYDESGHAAAVSAHLGTHHHEIRVTDKDAQDVIPLLPTIYDEPFADSSQIPTYLVCKSARQNVTVALSGDAGDELFGGYNRYLWGPPIWSRLERLGRPGRSAIAATMDVVPDSAWDTVGRIYRAVRSGDSGVILPSVKVRKLAASLKEADNFNQFYRNIASTWSDPALLLRDEHTEIDESLSGPLPEIALSHAEIMMFQDLRGYLPGDILCKVDRAAMAVSLETRIPFLDPGVIAASARLPINMKIRDGCGKWALRQILYRHVPRELIERPKAGFSVPLGDWLRGPLREWAEDFLAPVLNGHDDLLRSEPIQAVWKDHLSGRRDCSGRLWTILMLQAWRQNQ